MEQNVANTSDRDLMSIHTQLQAKITEGRERDWKVFLHPTTTADVVCNLETIPRDLGAVFTDKAASTASIDPPATSSVGEPTQFNVKVPESIGSSVQVQLKSLVDPSCIVQGSISGHSDTYIVTYTPKVRGRHSLIVKVDGREITGSPFQVFVKIHPTLLGKPVCVIDQPWDIAVTHNQQLVVTEKGEKQQVTEMEREYRPLNLNTSRVQLEWLQVQMEQYTSAMSSQNASSSSAKMENFCVKQRECLSSLYL